MLIGLRSALERAIVDACLKTFGVEPPRLVLETPPKVELGDLACPVAFELAKVLKRPPRKIAEELAPALVLPDIVVKRTVEGGGYLNFFVDRPKVLRAMLEDAHAPASTHGAPAPEAGKADKLIVEHTNINPNKAAHIGHLRNAVLGDVLVRTFRRLGRRVEVQNYLDDTGVQVADVVVALEHPEALVDPKRAAALGEEIREILDAFPHDAPGVPGRRLGDLAWDLYALVGKSYAADPDLEAARRDTLHAIEGAATGHDQTEDAKATAAVAARLAEAVVRCHLLTMERIGVDYDLLPRESDILARKFWVAAFERLKAAGAARLESEGKNAGCWVMPLEGSAEFEGMEDADKVLVRSNGTVTYTGKDVAYQLWKLGVLGIDFEYEAVPVRRRRREPGVPRLGRRLAALPDAPRRRGRGSVGPRPVRRRHGRHQRDRRPPVVSAEGRQGGRPERRLPRGRRPLGPLRVRDGRAHARFRRGARRRPHGRGPREAVRRDVGPQGSRREGRRPARPPRRQGARPDRLPRGAASRRRPGARSPSPSARCAST